MAGQPASVARWQVRSTGNGFGYLPAYRPPLCWLPPVQASPPEPAPGGSDPATPGTRTAAGWSFLAAPSVLTEPEAAGFVIEVRLDTAGFRAGRRALSPRSFAALVAGIRVRADQPILLLPSGTVQTLAAVDMLIGAFTDALGRAVTAADGPVWFTATGLATTEGVFRRFHPRDVRPGAPPSVRRIDVLGRFLPVVPSGWPSRPLHLTTDMPPEQAQPVQAVDASPTAVPVAAPAVAVCPPVEPALAEAVAVRPPAGAVPMAVAAGVARLVAADRWSPAATITCPHPLPVAAPAPAARTRAPAEAGPGVLDSAEPPGGTAPPAEPETPRPRPVAETAPVPPDPPTPVAHRPVPEAHAHPVPPETRPDPGEAARAAERPPPVPAPERGPEAGCPLWLPATDAGPEQVAADRAALRLELGGRYDSHARVVARILSEEPGLRAVADSAADITAGLVALRAYLLDERVAMNQALRGGGPDVDVDRMSLLARSAVRGLRRLPSVFGPVFRTIPAEASSAVYYRPGDELVEPAFVDVSLTASTDPDGGVEFAIWSVSAHRLAGLGADDGAALFPPGSRFSVIGVDEPSGDGSPARVLLRDLAAVRHSRAGARPPGAENTDRVVSRLRDAPRSRLIRPARTGVDFCIGLDPQGRGFRPPAAVPGARTGGSKGSEAVTAPAYRGGRA